MLDVVSLEPEGTLPESTDRKIVFVTGSAGNIGRYFAKNNADRYQLRLLIHGNDAEERASLGQFGTVVSGDITDLDSLKPHFKDVHTVLHLAGQASPSADWASLLKLNIIGTYNVFLLAKEFKCSRVIYASSIHAVSGYPADVQVKPSDPVNPGDLYGVTKCFGEALARYIAEQEGLSSIALRIGAFQPRSAAKGDAGIDMLDAFVSHRDLDQLIRKCIDARHLKFAIFNGLSDNRFKRLDITNARQILGYAPQDDTTELNDQLAALKLDDRVSAHNVSDDNQSSGFREQQLEVRET